MTQTVFDIMKDLIQAGDNTRKIFFDDVPENQNLPFYRITQISSEPKIHKDSTTTTTIDLTTYKIDNLTYKRTRVQVDYFDENKQTAFSNDVLGLLIANPREIEKDGHVHDIEVVSGPVPGTEEDSKVKIYKQMIELYVHSYKI